VRGSFVYLGRLPGCLKADSNQRSARKKVHFIAENICCVSMIRTISSPEGYQTSLAMEIWLVHFGARLGGWYSY
jgi:hypothetical protein